MRQCKKAKLKPLQYNLIHHVLLFYGYVQTALRDCNSYPLESWHLTSLNLLAYLFEQVTQHVYIHRNKGKFHALLEEPLPRGHGSVNI